MDVDLVFSEGQAVYGCLTDNWPTVEPYFNETGSNCPSILPTEQQRSLIDLSVQSAQALGLTQVRRAGESPKGTPGEASDTGEFARRACSTWSASTRRTARD